MFRLKSAIVVCALLVPSLTGCGRDASRSAASAGNESRRTETWGAEKSPIEPESAFARAKGLLRAGDYDSAADQVQQALLVDSDRDELILLAAKIEAARGNSQQAVELLGGLDPGRRRMGRAAAELLSEQAIKIADWESAEWALRELIRLDPREVKWRRRMQQTLHALGRRQEASEQADALCRMGTASTEELLSLIRRNEIFPNPSNDDVIEPAPFTAALFDAKSLAARGEFARAQQQLASQASTDFDNDASAAFYLWLLARQQNTNAFHSVHANCNDDVRLHADYWCALGLIFIDRSEYRAAVGVLLKAVQIDPTMRIAFQQLSRCCFALGRGDDGQQFRYRGLQLAETETVGRRIIEEPANVAAKSDLAKMLLDLGRPLEALHWTRAALPSSARREQAIVTSRLRETAALPQIDEIAATTALLGLQPLEFPYENALRELEAEGSSTTESDARTYSEIRKPLAMPRLIDVAAESHADFQWYHDVQSDLDSIPLFESVGGGIAVLDFDLDGWPDLYFAQGSGRPPLFECTRSSQLRRNVSALFRDVTDHSGAADYHYSSGVAAGDVNQDGFPDLYLGSLTQNRLLINNGDGTFRDATVQLPSQRPRFSTSLAIADISGDHLPDLFEVNYIESDGAFAQPKKDAEGNDELPSPLLFFPQADRLFLANGDGKFTEIEIGNDVAQAATGLGIIVSNFDDSGGNEIFVGNDLRPNHLLRYRDGKLVNLADASGIANGLHGLANGCMGIATGDFDRNGRLDLHVSNYRDESDNLFLQTDNGVFRDAAPSYRLRELTVPYVAFGTKAIDIDGNGWLDFAVTNGHIFDMRPASQGFRMPPQFMMCNGQEYQQAEVDDPSGYWQGEYLGRAMAVIDFDRDLSSDFVIGHLDAPTALLKNETNRKATSVLLELVGTTSERDAIGAKIVVRAGDIQIVQWVTAGDGYLCTDESYLDISVGGDQAIDAIDVHWPSSTVTTYRGVGGGNRYLLIENETEPFRR